MKKIQVILLCLFILSLVMRTASAQILGAPVTRIERICDDRLDNDADGNRDCSDADCSASPACIDADGDKYPVSKDCNDFDANIHPGAKEICNGFDDDCDSLFDDDDSSVGGQKPWYADADGDTYGDPAVSQTACNKPASYILRQGDCDDTDASVLPGGTETCNNKDDDCDGLTDDSDDGVTGKSTWYADGDNDSYGDGSVSLTSCAMPSGYVAVANDCDDTNALAYTGATESCDDDVDNECDGSTDCDDSDCTAEMSCKSPWPMFHGGPQHTGESPYNGPQTATVKWSYKLSSLSIIPLKLFWVATIFMQPFSPTPACHQLARR